jgi:hypothetical protein
MTDSMKDFCYKIGITNQNTVLSITNTVTIFQIKNNSIPYISYYHI